MWQKWRDQWQWQWKLNDLSPTITSWLNQLIESNCTRSRRLDVGLWSQTPTLSQGAIGSQKSLLNLNSWHSLWEEISSDLYRRQNGLPKSNWSVPLVVAVDLRWFIITIYSIDSCRSYSALKKKLGDFPIFFVTLSLSVF